MYCLFLLSCFHAQNHVLSPNVFYTFGGPGVEQTISLDTGVYKHRLTMLKIILTHWHIVTIDIFIFNTLTHSYHRHITWWWFALLGETIDGLCVTCYLTLKGPWFFF